MQKNPLEDVQAILLDIDGTLIDSNEAHAKAWLEVLVEEGVDTSYDQIREKIGMGGDHLLPLVSGIEETSALGQKISKKRGELFRQKYLPTLKPFPQTRELLETLKARGIELVVATSASKQDLEKLLEQAGIADLLKKKTSSDEAESSKPDPDIIEAALAKTSCPKARVRMLGDTPYDIEAARRAGIETIAFTCGGWRAQDLQKAKDIYDGPSDLLAAIL
jgi:HAD superfamily hydrolase (TIGR01509 family)